LTTKKFALLPYLMRNAGRRLTRAMIIEHVWNLNFDSTTNVVDVYINDLRRKVDDGFTPSLIHIVRGVGYQVSHEGRRQKGRGHECREDAVATPASQPSRASSNRQ
jgi:DNA-binding response OmpR family regulator